jgi:hypothetical protein
MSGNVYDYGARRRIDSLMLPYQMNRLVFHSNSISLELKITYVAQDGLRESFVFSTPYGRNDIVLHSMMRMDGTPLLVEINKEQDNEQDEENRPDVVFIIVDVNQFGTVCVHAQDATQPPYGSSPITDNYTTFNQLAGYRRN